MGVRRIFVAVLLLVSAGESLAACEIGRSLGRHEPSLQSVFDSLLGAHVLSARNDCLTADSAWSTPPQLTASIVIELGAFAPKNEFGIYDESNTSDRIRLFASRDFTGASANVQFTSNGHGFDVTVNGKSKGTIGSAFGFYLSTPHDVFFSDPAFNRGEDHMLAYRGNGSPFLKGPFAGTTFTAGMYLLGFEDLPLRRSDRDYQDFVALVNTAMPVPVPSGIAFLASSLLIAAAWRRSIVATAT